MSTTLKDSRLNICCDTQVRALLDQPAGHARVSVPSSFSRMP